MPSTIKTTIYVEILDPVFSYYSSPDRELRIMSFIDELLERRRQEFEKLRKLQPEIMKTIDGIDDYLAKSRKNYKNFEEAGDCIADYLTEAGKALSREDIVSAVVGRGFRQDKPDRAHGDVRRSITRWINSGEKIKEINDLVGLIDWSEDKFTPAPK